MLWLKTCPRCRGDVYTEKDIFETYETYLKCLQCGHVLSEVERQQAELERRPPTSSGSKPLPGQQAA